jgi:hypothetical protein
MAVAALAVVTLLCAALCFRMAKRKNRSVRFWVAMGVLSGPLAPILLWPLGRIETTNLDSTV